MSNAKQTGNMKNKAGAEKRGPAPATRPSTTEQPVNPPIAGTGAGTPANVRSWWTSIQLPGRFMLPLRLFLGITFIYAGIQKLTDPQYFNQSAPGFIGKQIIGFAIGSPIHDFLIRVVVPHTMFFGALVACGELAIGLGALFGFLLRPASFFGLLLSMMFFLSASWRVHPYFYGADIVFVFCWITLLLAGPLRSGLPSLDALLVPRWLMSVSGESRARLRPALNFLLGVGEEDKTRVQQPQEMPTQTTQGGQATAYNSTVRGYPQGVPQSIMSNQGRPGYAQGMPQQQRPGSYRGKQAAMRRQESRRVFLWGLVAGGLGMLGITFFGGKALQVLQTGGDDSASSLQNTGSGSTSGSAAATAPAGSTPGAAGAIAQVSAVPDNSAVTFTLPSNGDPGVLIHLSNGKFVAFDATCTHAGCPVNYDPSSQHLFCPCHGAEFDPSNGGAVVQGPTNTPLASVPIHIDNGSITLQA